MHYIIAIIIIICIISAIIGWIKEHIKGFSIFILVVGGIAGLVYLYKTGVNIWPIVTALVIIIISILIICGLVSYVRSVRLEKLHNNIRAYISCIGPEANYEKLKNDMHMKFGDIVIGKENSNDFLKKTLDSYVKGNIAVVNDGIMDIISHFGMMSRNELYTQVNKVYGRYCVGDSSINSVCDKFTKKSCEKYELENDTVFKLPGAVTGQSLISEEISDVELESMELNSTEIDVDLLGIDESMIENQVKPKKRGRPRKTPQNVGT